MHVFTPPEPAGRSADSPPNRFLVKFMIYRRLSAGPQAGALRNCPIAGKGCRGIGRRSTGRFRFAAQSETERVQTTQPRHAPRPDPPATAPARSGHSFVTWKFHCGGLVEEPGCVRKL